MASTQIIEKTCPKKRTTVRTLFAARVVGPLMPLGMRVAPRWTARRLVDLMFRLPRIRRPDWETAVLARGRRFDMPLGDGTLACWTWGMGPALVLVHGWAGRGSQLGMLVDPLVKHGFRVVTFDGPGHGDTTATRASMADQARAVKTVVGHLGDVWGIVAHSMGVGACLFACTRGIACSRLVFLAGAPDATDYFDECADGFDLNRSARQCITAELEQRFHVKVADFKTTQYAPEIKPHCLVIHDHDDKEVPVIKSQVLAQSLPHAQSVFTHGLGHRRLLKDPEVISRIVAFLADDPAHSKRGG